MSFDEQYKKIKDITASELKIIEEKTISSIRTREPLNSYIIEFLTAPAKRIRPVLAILYTKALEQELSEEQLELLSAIELVHSASLIHDDIIDESKFRRGHKTISEKFDNKLAVISGDYILSLAMEKISKLGSIKILENFSTTLNKMCQGEINQNFDRYKIGTPEEYIEKSKNKTAYLFETALVCCAILAQKNNLFNLNSISSFGLNVGIAFQIKDDLKNLSDVDTSKPVNNDISNGIYNAPIIFSGSIENYSSGIEKTQILLNNYIQQAAKELNLLPENKYKNALKNFLELLNNE